MPFTQMRFLTTSRIQRIIGTLAAQLEIERPLVYLRRLPLVPAFDDELFGRFTGKLIAAELLAEDQKAVVHESLKLELRSHTLPKIKIGESLGERLLTRIRQLEEGALSPQGENAFRDWDMQLAERLLQQVRQRQNAMAAAMMLDAWSHNRFGLQVANATWGMPSNLKVNAFAAWAANPTTATPLSDIWAVDQVARLAYGVEFDHVTMSTADFRAMALTTEFSNKVSIMLKAAFLVTPAAMPTKNDPEMLRIAMQILGKTIEIDDATFTERNADGSETTTRYLPIGKVLLSRTQDHNSGNAYDMANGLVMESMVADLIGGAPEGLGGEKYGPVSFYTGIPDLNPPRVTAWAVAKNFPRKFIPESTAVLSVA